MQEDARIQMKNLVYEELKVLKESQLGISKIRAPESKAEFERKRSGSNKKPDALQFEQEGKYNWMKERKAKLRKMMGQALKKRLDQVKREQEKEAIEQKNTAAANSINVRKKYEDLLKSEFELKLKDQASRIQSLTQSIDYNNLDMLKEIKECREEFFMLENQKPVIDDKYIPCDEVYGVLKDIQQHGLDLSKEVEILRPQELDNPMDEKNAEIRKMQKRKRNGMNSLLNKLHSYIEHCNRQETDHKKKIKKLTNTANDLSSDKQMLRQHLKDRDE